MAAATVIHFGDDDCHRVEVLRGAGYEVDEFNSLDRLRLHLVSRKHVDAVIVSEVEPRCAEQAAELVREHSGAALILFRRPDVTLDDSGFDRVFPSVARPPHWLFDTAVVVMQSKELRAQSERLRAESEAARVGTVRQRHRTASLIRELPSPWADLDDPDKKE
ncbi:MAG TPA: hypothetical protein VKB38_23180 [Terracidiphilus sp.]|nr:hypothetical protein [Terracidiphilus sp.]